MPVAMTQTHLIMQPPHKLHIHTPETMSTRSQEEETHMDSVVRDGHTVHSGLCLKKDVELFINVFYDRLPATRVIYTVTKS